MSEADGRNFARGECPSCGMPVPFAKTLVRRGQSFACLGCGSTIMLAKMDAAGIVTAVGLIAMAHFVGLAPALLGCVLVTLADWKRVRVSVADRSN